ncbi:MAG: hypothetical protein D6693_07705 [Planctomycetota bacterium]|nr:MAG: hypothetical protein D6693_07705 [Planctomycetota bacterium]
MPFTGKATYSAGASLPELAEDVSDIVGIISPFETPLLDHLGDPRRAARSTVHEWIEDALLPNTDAVNQTVFTPDATSATDITVDTGSRFRVGDQVKPGASDEIMFVTAVAGNVITVVRGYGGTTPGPLADNQPLLIVANAALEGADADAPRFSNRVRKQNFTQIFSATVEVSGSQRAADAVGVEDELDFQTQQRLRELLRDLEAAVINGVAPAADPQGSATTRRSMNGVLKLLTTNRFVPKTGPIPAGDGFAEDILNEAVLNAAIRVVWEQSSSAIDTIVAPGLQKRLINNFASDKRGFTPADTRFRDLISVYESDFGVARVILSRAVPDNTILLLDSSRIDVLPLAGRSFHFKPLASQGDRDAGQVIGEYTLELRNENAHAVITNLGV